MKKSTSLLFSLLLACTSQTFANRPGASESPVSTGEIPTSNTALTNRPERVVTQQVTGDALEIAPGETIDIKPLSFPSRGMSMKKVLNGLGNPNKTIDAVGNPPIRQWIYDDRTVYFEQMSVIHVVAKP